MNINKRLKKMGIATAIGVTAILSSVAVNAATIGFIGDDGLVGGDIVRPGNVPTFSLTLVADDLIAFSYGGGLGITFDNTVVSVTGSTLDNVWLGLSPPPTVDNVAGTFEVSVGAFFFGSSPINTTRQGIVTIDFAVVGDGQFDFGLYSLGQVGDWAYTPDSVPAGINDLTYCMTPDSTLPTTCLDSIPDATGRELLTLASSHMAVPVPAAVWLFGSGLIGLVAVSRRKAA